MKLLRETIRNMILQESRKQRRLYEKKQSPGTCSRLNSMIQQGVQEMENFDLDVVHWIDSNGLRILFKHAIDNEKVAIMKATNNEWTLGGDCHGAWMVEWANVKPDYRGTGLGALLYDIALELVGETGLMPDRNQVSMEAIRNWNYFYGSTDYKKKPLDDQEGSYTENPADDCEAESYWDHRPSTWSGNSIAMGPTKQEFQSHPLNNVIVKKDQSQPTITCLQNQGRLRERGSS